MDLQINTINCRVCLQYESNSISLFETCNNSFIAEKINSIADVKIVEGDGLPNTICRECLLQLENAVSFKQKCEASNKILLSSLLLIKQCTELNSENSTEQETEICNRSTPVNLKIELSSNPDEHYYYEDYSESEGRVDDAIETSKDKEDIPLQKSKAIDVKLICDDCGGSFKSKCKMQVHWKKVHLPEKLICHKCKRMFKIYRTFNLHKKKNIRYCEAAAKMRIEGQGKSRVYYCKECNYQTNNLNRIEPHLVTHTGERRFQCKDCPKKFTQQSSLCSHRERSHNDYKVDTTCKLCGKHIQGRDKLYKHMKTHNLQVVQCKVCNKNLKSKDTLAVHMLRHSGVKSYSCEICAASFYTYSEVYIHRKTHVKSRDLKCDLCDYKVCTKTLLKRHRSRHTGTNIVCLVCGQFSENAEKFALHQQIHLDRNVQCPYCDKKYHNKKSLNKHVSKIHRCKMLVNKREKTIVTEIKEES